MKRAPGPSFGYTVPALALSLLGLVLAAVALGIVAWLLGGQASATIQPLLSILVPATLAVGFLMYRHHRSRQLARQLLQGVEARISGIAEPAMDPIICVDDHDRILLFNAAAERAFRWPRGAVMGQPLDMLIPKRFHATHRDHLEQFRRTGVTARRMGGASAITALRADGEEFPIEASISQHVEDGRKVLTVILRDVTERVASAAALSRSEARLRGILDSAMDAIITIDEQQKIVFFNAAAEKMFGCPQEEAIGSPLTWFLPDRYRQSHMQHVSDFAATGVTSRRMGGSRVVTGLRRNGEEFPIDASISQLADADARFYTVILRDVSERARAHDALSRSREELRDLASAASGAREQEQSRIARELHDELAQAMSALKMDVKLIRSSTAPDNASLVQRLDRMEAQIDATIAAMRRIAADLRPLTLDDLGLVPAIEALVQDFGRRTGLRCELAIADGGLQLPAAHATAIYRIVQESLTNVAKHALATMVEVVLATEAENAVTVMIRDDGVGFSTSDPRKPHSFGLLGVRERAYLLGGEIHIVSAPGKGTEIEAWLPLDAAATRV